MATGLIVRQEEPTNLESPCSIVDSFLTPTDLFYVRNHFDVPHLDVANWRVVVEGEVETRRAFTHTELTSLPSQKVTATLECAGNGRTFLDQSKGVQWHLGAVGNAEWEGVPLSVVLAHSGLKPTAAEIILEGADAGQITDDPATPGRIHYARSLPLHKAIEDHVLLAYKMNGEPLTQLHGFPVRAVVPGWYGMASVKWLRRIVVSSSRFQGYFQTFEYSRWENRDGMPNLVPLTHIEVKAEIMSPRSGETVRRGESFSIGGAAWAGECEVAAVDVSTDGGVNWSRATLLDEARRHSWVRWRREWNVPQEPGSVTLLARATDARGRSQPFHHCDCDRHYSVHHVLPITVDIS